mmetsp:Transcript_19319/g.47405  ORF Transcript_19319/g.47405 Transcript_19319/m.47405 type:complete len:206 (-) Transcript_19319:12-629(-)
MLHTCHASLVLAFTVREQDFVSGAVEHKPEGDEQVGQEHAHEGRAALARYIGRQHVVGQDGHESRGRVRGVADRRDADPVFPLVEGIESDNEEGELQEGLAQEEALEPQRRADEERILVHVRIECPQSGAEARHNRGRQHHRGVEEKRRGNVRGEEELEDGVADWGGLWSLLGRRHGAQGTRSTGKAAPRASGSGSLSPRLRQDE